MPKIHHHNTLIRKAGHFYFWVCSKHKILTKDVHRIQSREVKDEFSFSNSKNKEDFAL